MCVLYIHVYQREKKIILKNVHKLNHPHSHQNYKLYIYIWDIKSCMRMCVVRIYRGLVRKYVCFYMVVCASSC